MTLPEHMKQVTDFIGLTTKRLESIPTVDTAAMAAENAKLKTDLDALTASYASLTEGYAKLTEANKILAADLKTAAETILNPAGEIQKQAAMKASAIAIAQGVPPVREETTTNASKSRDELWAECNQISDPVAKRQFYLANIERM